MSTQMDIGTESLKKKKKKNCVGGKRLMYCTYFQISIIWKIRHLNFPEFMKTIYLDIICSHPVNIHVELYTCIHINSCLEILQNLRGKENTICR